MRECVWSNRNNCYLQIFVAQSTGPGRLEGQEGAAVSVLPGEPPPSSFSTQGVGGLQAELGSQAASENGTPLGLSGICISLLVNYLFTLFLNGNTCLLGISSFP